MTSAQATASIFLLIIALSTSLRRGLADCQQFSALPGRSGSCDRSNSPDCCVDGQSYPQFLCSPAVGAVTWAAMRLNSFQEGAHGGQPSECDDSYHADTVLVVALSTGWFAGMSRCGRAIKITGRDGSSVLATMVDECDSVNGCDAEHNFEAPCGNNVVDASPAVWLALNLDMNVGIEDVTWSDV